MVSAVAASPFQGVTIESVEEQKPYIKEIQKFFESRNLEAPTMRESTIDGKNVVVLEIPESTKEALKNNPALLEEVKSGLGGLCLGGCAGGICAGLIIAVCIFVPFAIAGGVVLGIGQQRLIDNDPNNNIQAAEMVLAGKWVLGGGAIFSGVIGGLYACITGCGICIAGS